MKVIIAAEIFFPDIGGPATYAKDLAENLAKNNENVVVICYSDDSIDHEDGHEKSQKHENSQRNVAGGPYTRPSARPSPYKIIRIKRGKNAVLRYIKYFLKLFFLAKNGDVIYAQGSASGGFPAYLTHKMLGNRFILRVGGDYSWEWAYNAGITQLSVDDFNENLAITTIAANAAFLANNAISAINTKNLFLKIKFKLIRSMQILTARKAENVVVASKYLKGIVEKWGVASEKIIVIPSSFESRASNGPHGLNSRELNIKSARDKKEFIIFSAGRFVPWKGFEALINIIPELSKQIPDLKLIIAGDGPRFESCKQLVENLGAGNKIILFGRANSAQMDELYKSADVFILNSGYEGLSHILVEAMSNGLPVIASNIGGNREIVQDEVNGLLVPYNDENLLKLAIFKIFSDKNLRDTISFEALKTSENFKFSFSFENIKKVIHRQ